MKSRFIAAGTVAVLALGFAQAVSADPGLDCTPLTCKTDVSVTVLEGTTILAPASVNVVSGFPGQTVDSATQTVDWWSNQQSLQLTVQLDTDLKRTGTPDTFIARSDVSVTSDDYSDPATLDNASPVADIADVSSGTLEAASSADFQLHVFIPSATEGTYTAKMTWTVQ